MYLFSSVVIIFIIIHPKKLFITRKISAVQSANSKSAIQFFTMECLG